MIITVIAFIFLAIQQLERFCSILCYHFNHQVVGKDKLAQPNILCCYNFVIDDNEGVISSHLLINFANKDTWCQYALPQYSPSSIHFRGQKIILHAVHKYLWVWGTKFKVCLEEKHSDHWACKYRLFFERIGDST